jgi:hypothetical protein
LQLKTKRFTHSLAFGVPEVHVAVLLHNELRLRAFAAAWRLAGEREESENTTEKREHKDEEIIKEKYKYNQESKHRTYAKDDNAMVFGLGFLVLRQIPIQASAG